MSLDELTDVELDELGEALQQELRHRALLRFEPATVADQAFIERFDSKQWPADPTIIGGLLVCCGALKGRPGGHRCSFVSINGEAWCWDVGHEHDELRWQSETELSTVTILIAVPGMLVTSVESTADQGGHHRKSATSWRIDRGVLEPVATPSRVPQDHRR